MMRRATPIAPRPTTPNAKDELLLTYLSRHRAVFRTTPLGEFARAAAVHLQLSPEEALARLNAICEHFRRVRDALPERVPQEAALAADRHLPYFSLLLECAEGTDGTGDERTVRQGRREVKVVTRSVAKGDGNGKGVGSNGASGKVEVGNGRDVGVSGKGGSGQTGGSDGKTGASNGQGGACNVEAVVSNTQPIVANAQPVVSSAQPVVSSAQAVVSNAHTVPSSTQPITSTAQKEGREPCDSSDGAADEGERRFARSRAGTSRLRKRRRMEGGMESEKEEEKGGEKEEANEERLKKKELLVKEAELDMRLRRARLDLDMVREMRESAMALMTMGEKDAAKELMKRVVKALKEG